MKKNNKTLTILYMLFAALLICANCIAAKQIPIGNYFGEDIAITAGILCYPFTFLITDIIGEVWGKIQAKRAVIGGFIGQIICISLITLASILPGSDSNISMMFSQILGSNWILVIGSLLAFVLSQSWDVYIFHKVRDWYIKKHKSTKGGRWIWENISTITSQLIDSVVFYIGLIIMLSTLGITLPFNVICITIFIYWITKIVIAVVDTPIFYLLTNKSTKELEETLNKSTIENDSNN